MKQKQQNSALSRAIEIVGSQKILAEKLGVTQQIISYWLKHNKFPAEHVSDAEKATGGIITRHQLRPDLFGEHQ